MTTYILNATRTLSQAAPEIAMLRDGRVVAVWSGDGQDPGAAGGEGVYLSILDADFSYRRTGEIRAPQETDGRQDRPQVAALQDGGFVVAWSSDGPSARSGVQDGFDDVYLRFFNADGSPRGDEIQISPQADRHFTLQDMAVLADGSVAAVATREGAAAQSDLVAYRYSAAGAFVGARTLARDIDVAGADPAARIAPAADGGYGVAWRGFEDLLPGAEEGLRVYAQSFSPTGRPRQGRQTVTVDPYAAELDQDSPDLAALAGGGFAAIWDRSMDAGDPSQIDVYFRLLGPGGGPQGRPVLVNADDREGRQIAADILDLGGGMSLVTFLSEREGTGPQTLSMLRGRIFDAAGRPFGAAFDISEFAMGGMADPNSLLGPDGVLISTWTAESDPAFGPDVFGVAQPLPRLRWLGGPGDDALRGSEIRDELRGEGGADDLSGEGGDDLLYGGFGDDRLTGGAGQDALYGQQGNDRLFGGDGDDHLSASAGDDWISGGNGDDRIYPGAGNDQMEGGAGADVFVFAAAWGVDAIRDFGRGGDRIDLSAAGYGSFAEVMADARNSRGDTLITAGDGSVLRIAAIPPGALDAGDFVF